MPFSDSVHCFLASGSPRRKALLADMGLRFEVLSIDVDETLVGEEAAADYVCRLAIAKARAGLDMTEPGGTIPVIGADTSVVCGGRILGKPASLAEAQEMLTLLSGGMHEVMTAVCVASHRRQALGLSISRVFFRQLSEAEISAYWATGEPVDKAGGYAIQGLGALFVERLEGSYSGVVGLPVFETATLLSGFGISTVQILTEHKRGI